MNNQFLISMILTFCICSTSVFGQNIIIKSIKTESVSFNNSFDQLDSVYFSGDTAFVLKSLEFYNEQAELVSRIEFYSNGKKKNEELNDYDIKKRLQKSTHIEYNGAVDRVEMIYHYKQTDSVKRVEIIDNGEAFLNLIYERDSTGKLLSHSTLSNGDETNKIKYKYYPDGKLFKIQKFNASGEYSSIERKYNDSGQLVLEKKIGTDIFWSCQDTCYNFYFHDSIGNRILSKQNWINDSNYFEQTMIYHPNNKVKEIRREWKACVKCAEIERYDENGNLISLEKNHDSEGKKRGWYYLYKYDPNGNWILKTETDSNGVKSLTKRKIEYY